MPRDAAAPCDAPTKQPPGEPSGELPDDWYADVREDEQDAFTRRLGPRERNEWPWHWAFHAHPGQRPPPGDWSIWLIMAGRGFGKTRAGAEWVRSIAETDPAARIALVAATLGEARSVMVEGESGILACSPPDRRPHFEPSLHRLSWPAGAQATLYSALEAESLRGPQHSHARRAGPEGSLCQRSPRTRRCADALRRGRRSDGSALDSGRRNQLARRHAGLRRLDRAGGQSGMPPGRKLALRHPSRRAADRRSGDRTGASLHGRLAYRRSSCGTIRRFSR